MGNLPALITSGDLLPGRGALNGRRWAGQQLLKSWAARSGARPMALASPRPESLQQLLAFSCANRGLTVSSMAWICFPQKLSFPGAACFFRILPLAVGLCGGNPLGLRHFRSSVRFTLFSTPAALAHLQDLVSEPVQPWDALDLFQHGWTFCC